MPKLTGHAAIAAAEAAGVALNKYADPTERAREGLTLAEAREIAREDPSLIWVDADEAATYTVSERRGGAWITVATRAQAGAVVGSANWTGPGTYTLRRGDGSVTYRVDREPPTHYLIDRMGALGWILAHTADSWADVAAWLGGGPLPEPPALPWTATIAGVEYRVTVTAAPR